jgi:ABC-type multidrug transport system ATPase subunit
LSHLVADSITCHLGDGFVLSHVYLSIRSPDVVGLLGRNGSGKTTLLRTLFGLAEASSGVLKIDGDFVTPGHRWRRMAYLPQGSFLPRDQRVRAAARSFLGRRGEDLVRQDHRLGQLLQRRTGELSVGERRLLEFTLVLGLGRRFVLLDEPFSQIEPIYVQLMSESIRAQSPECAFLITDHNHWSVREVCTSLLYIEGGKLRRIGSGDSDLRRAGYLPNDRPEVAVDS